MAIPVTIARPALPERRNPMLEEERAPPYEILVERRCLGQTELKVKPGQTAISNATKPENLGVLDYAHLRVPLPKDLTGSGIFARGPNRKWPESYFLMRRSSDGFVSATGMFKAAFPFAQVEEEAVEKDYIKSLEATSSEEVAGNVWIDPGKALDLAEEYGIKLWIAVLLDPEPITHGTSDPTKDIKSPPSYQMRATANATARPTEKFSPDADSVRQPRLPRGTRNLRSVSPSGTNKAAKTTPRKIATPRRPRRPRAEALASVDEDATRREGKVNGEKETVTVQVENTVLPNSTGDEHVESTKVQIELPAHHPDFKLPESAEEMLEQAREMVREANAIGELASPRRGKRKAEEMIDTDDEVGLNGPPRAAKRQRPVDIELRREQIRRRALTGVVGSLAIGMLIPAFATALGWT